MGMYDYLKCEIPLPTKETEFQSKDLKCEMFHYKITSEGELYRIKDNKELYVGYNGPLHFGSERNLYMALFVHGKVEEIYLRVMPSYGANLDEKA